MKTKTIAAILFAGAMALLAPRPVSAAWSVSIGYFHHELAPYGRWVYTSRYGEVWYPTVVRARWAPYVDGEWVYTDCGWTWVSYDPFDAPFHYGTWVWVDTYGWCWEPGYTWGPAWVSWAWTDRYVGWAPLPASFAITASGYYGGAVTVAPSQYIFVPANQFVGTNVSTVRVPTTENTTILAGAQRATRFSVSRGLVHMGGPPAAFVQRATGKSLRAVSVSSVSHNLKPATIAAAGVRFGRRIPIAAPVHKRAARAARLDSKGASPASSKIARHGAPPPKGTPRQVAARMRGERLKTPSHVQIARRAHSEIAVAPRHAARIPRQAVEKRPAFADSQPPGLTHRERVSSAPPPRFTERFTERKHEAPPAAIREERRTAMSRAFEQPRPAGHQAPPPQAAQPRPGPPPAMARPPERSQPQPGGNKKEKPG